MPQHITHVRGFIFLSVLTLMYVVESLRPERDWTTPRVKRLAVHGTLAAFNTLVLRLTVAGPLLFLAQLMRDKHWGLAGLLGLSGTPEILATLVVFDCYDYWWHKVNHVVPFLWRFNRAHHLDTHVDVTTSLRFHPGELLLSGIAKALWILSWGPSPWGFALFEAGTTAAAQFHHSNFDFSDAWERVVRRIAMTPRVHASHHTATIRSRDANYATIFSIWDRWFGTFEEPGREELNVLGLPEGRSDYLSFAAILMAPFM